MGTPVNAIVIRGPFIQGSKSELGIFGWQKSGEPCGGSLAPGGAPLRGSGFTRDAPRTGPHVLQFATREQAFIVQLHNDPPLAFLREVLESSAMVKVGFGLKSDRGPLQHKLGLKLGASIDLATGMRKLGYKQAVGVRTAVAIALGRRLHKSKSATTSNWAAINLSDGQVQYAGEDAFAAVAVFYALGMGDKSVS